MNTKENWEIDTILVYNKGNITKQWGWNTKW